MLNFACGRDSQFHKQGLGFWWPIHSSLTDWIRTERERKRMKRCDDVLLKCIAIFPFDPLKLSLRTRSYGVDVDTGAPRLLLLLLCGRFCFFSSSFFYLGGIKIRTLINYDTVNRRRCVSVSETCHFVAVFFFWKHVRSLYGSHHPFLPILNIIFIFHFFCQNRNWCCDRVRMQCDGNIEVYVFIVLWRAVCRWTVNELMDKHRSWLLNFYFDRIGEVGFIMILGLMKHAVAAVELLSWRWRYSNAIFHWIHSSLVIVEIVEWNVISFE